MPYPSDDTHPSAQTWPGLYGEEVVPGVGQGMKMAITDLDGNILTDLSNRSPGSFVKFVLNDHRTAQVTLSMALVAALKVDPFNKALAIWLDGAPIFRGPITLPHWAAGASQRPGDVDPAEQVGTVVAAATQPSLHLEDGFVNMVLPPTSGFLNIDQGDLMWKLILKSMQDLQLANGPNLPHFRGHGIKKGSWSGSIDRDRHYGEGQNAWEAIQQLSNVEDGADFDFRPLRDDEIGPTVLDGMDGNNLVEFDVFYPRMGQDRTGQVRFEYGYGRHNTAAFVWEPGGELVNLSRWIGKPPPDSKIVFDGMEYDLCPQAYAWNIDSIRQYGLYQETVNDPDIKEKNTLREHARGSVKHRCHPKDFVEITPAVERGGNVFAWARNDDGILQPLPMEGLGAPPKFGPDTGSGGQHDYFMGDTVRFLARQSPSIDLQLNARVTEATITEVDDAGTLVVELVVATDQDSAGGIDDYADDFAISLTGPHHGKKHHHRHHHHHHHHRHRHHRSKVSDLF